MQLGDKHHGGGSRKKRCLLPCLITTTLLIIVLLVVTISLALTVFRPRDPTVTIYPVGLKDHNLTELLFATNVSTTMIIGIDNPNHAGFKYRDATTLVLYRGQVVGEVPVPANVVPPRSQVNVTTSAVLMASVLKVKAVEEIGAGFLNLTSRVTLHGKSTFLGVRVRTSAYTECKLTITVGEVLSGTSWCWSRLKIE